MITNFCPLCIIDDLDFAINISIIGYHSVYALRIIRTGWHRCTTSIQCAVSFSPRKRSRKKKWVQTECLQSVHLYSLSRSGELHSDVRLPRAALRQQQFSKVKTVFIVLNFIHISFLCWKQIEVSLISGHRSFFPFTSKHWTTILPTRLLKRAK